jgi:hypothetical protein
VQEGEGLLDNIVTPTLNHLVKIDVYDECSEDDTDDTCSSWSSYHSDDAVTGLGAKKQIQNVKKKNLVRVKNRKRTKLMRARVSLFLSDLTALCM